MTESRDVDTEAIDAALGVWRQGDCAVGEHWFVHRFSPSSPLTDTAASVPQGATDLAEDPVAGFVILTQTCDVVRQCNDRPFLEIAPLVEVDDQDLKLIKRGHRPRYAYVPGVAENLLVVDLDSVMTIEKAVVACWNRIPGCHSVEEVTRFAQAIARKRSRFAFPDDFSALVKKLQSRLQEKHDRQSMEGQALRSLREIRVNVSPSLHLVMLTSISGSFGTSRPKIITVWAGMN